MSAPVPSENDATADDMVVLCGGAIVIPLRDIRHVRKILLRRTGAATVAAFMDENNQVRVGASDPDGALRLWILRDSIAFEIAAASGHPCTCEEYTPPAKQE